MNEDRIRELDSAALQGLERKTSVTLTAPELHALCAVAMQAKEWEKAAQRWRDRTTTAEEERDASLVQAARALADLTKERKLRPADEHQATQLPAWRMTPKHLADALNELGCDKPEATAEVQRHIEALEAENKRIQARCEALEVALSERTKSMQEAQEESARFRRGRDDWKERAILPAETVMVTFPGEFVSMEEIDRRARGMGDGGRIVLMAQQAQALGTDVLTLSRYYGRPQGAPTTVLSARDEFAKAAMQATVTPTSSDATRAEIAQRAYTMADAMIAARDNREDPRLVAEHNAGFAAGAEHVRTGAKEAVIYVNKASNGCMSMNDLLAAIDGVEA